MSPESSQQHSPSTALPLPDRRGAWLAAVRPRTLTLSVTPVLVGTSLAGVEVGTVMPTIALATLLAAMLIQMGTNLHNDAADHDSGADLQHRLGPPRAVAMGWLSSREVRRAAVLCFALAFFLGCFLATRGGWAIVTIGLASLLAGFAYSGGPWRISYSSLGEVFVLLFFGLAAVAGTCFLQTGMLTPTAMLAGVFVGAPACAVLTVNNHRDREQDLRAGRRTLAIVLGESGAKGAFAAMIAAPFLLLPLLVPGHGWWWMLPLLTLPWAVRIARQLWREAVGSGLNVVLGRTARLQLAQGISLSAAWLLPLWLA